MINRTMDFNQLCIDNRLATDFLIRYEYLDEDIKKLELKIGCPGLLETFKGISDKIDIRPPGKDIYTVYSNHPIARAIIDERYKKAMENELVAKYFPLYKQRLSRRVPQPGYFSLLAAKLLFTLVKIRNKGRPLKTLYRS